jgi:hypothetical protein
MPEGVTQTKTPTFSETWPEIDRNGGRVGANEAGAGQWRRSIDIFWMNVA